LVTIFPDFFSGGPAWGFWDCAPVFLCARIPGIIENLVHDRRGFHLGQTPDGGGDGSSFGGRGRAWLAEKTERSVSLRLKVAGDGRAVEERLARKKGCGSKALVRFRPRGFEDVLPQGDLAPAREIEGGLWEGGPDGS